MTDLYDGIAKVSGALVWPLAGLVAVALFRGPVARLIDRIDKIKGGPVDLATQPRPQQAAVAAAGTGLDKPPIAEGWTDLKANPVTGRIASRLEVDVQKLEEGKRIPWLAGFLARTITDLIYENLYRAIFGSQLQLLDRLNAATALHESVAREIFSRAAAAFPEAHKDRTFDVWLGWLVSQDLAVVEGDLVKSGRLTQDFLQFLPRRGLVMSKLG